MKLNRSIIALLIFLMSYSQLISSSGEDLCSSSTTTSSTISSTGWLKVFIIFAQFKDDNSYSTNWPADSLPSWADAFVNSTTGGSYDYNNLSQYYYEMSNGNFEVIGDVYDTLVVTEKDESEYSHIKNVNTEILTNVDPYVDFSGYDNLDGFSSGTDGIVDLVMIIYRNRTSLFGFSARANMELDSNITTNDGVSIYTIPYFWQIGYGVFMRNGKKGRDFTVDCISHEIGHYLFGGGHINGISNLGLMTGSPYWDDDAGMCAWEREYLGWIDYVDITQDTTFWISDYMSTDTAFRIPLDDDNFFIIENRQQINDHDYAEDEGIYFYHAEDSPSWRDFLDVKCADGNWDFSYNSTTEIVTRDSPNVDGENEMQYYLSIGLNEYAGCYYPFYPNDDAGGDSEDAFDLTFNNVLSPSSNPSSLNSSSVEVSFEIVDKSGSQYQIAVYFDDATDDEYEGSPAKPVLLEFSWSSNHPRLDWDANSEPDFDHYNIYKKDGASSYSLLTTTENNYYVDNSETKYSIGNDKTIVYYKVSAEDEDDKESLKTNSVQGAVNEPLEKRIDNYLDNIVSQLEFELFENHPNPYNPSTNIIYQLPENGHVTLKVYDMLGREVAVLVNSVRAPGRYEVQFDGSNLASGTYIYQIIVNALGEGKGYSASKKMLLIK